MNHSTDNPHAVEVRNLTKIYGSGNTEVVAMKDVSFSGGQGRSRGTARPQRRGQIHPPDRYRDSSIPRPRAHFPLAASQ